MTLDIDRRERPLDSIDRPIERRSDRFGDDTSLESSGKLSKIVP